MPLARDLLAVAAAKRLLERREVLVKLRGKDGDNATDAQIAAAVAQYLRAHLRQPKDGRTPTRAEIESIAFEWLAKNIKQPCDGRTPTREEVVEIAQRYLRENISQPKDGRSATPAEISAAVANWMAANFTQPKDGVGVKDIEFAGSYITITLTDGRSFRHRIQSRAAPGGQPMQLGDEFMFDDYDGEPEYLQDQVVTDIGTPLVFTFPGKPVNKIWVQIIPANQDDVTTGRFTVGSTVPTADIGTPLQAGQTQPISCPPTNTCSALVPFLGARVAVYAYRRKNK